LEHIYLLVRIKDDPIKTSVICSNLCVDSKFPYRVFHDVKIDYLTNLDPYKNNSLQMTLKVHHKDTTVEWITMKRSSIRNGGFGIFACRTFNVGELVTVYLGEMFLTWIHQLWKFVLIATKDVIVGKVAKNASNYFVYFVMIISKLMLKLLMFSLS